MNSRSEMELGRRRFLGTALALGTLAAAGKGHAQAESAGPRLKLGVVGCGGRGAWIAELFKQHGGYEMHAVADYFQEVADACGDSLGVDPARRFSGLSGYLRVIESGIDAIALETPPYFIPEHAEAAVAAGLHVYMAKPVAVDAPGCARILEASRQATAAQRCFLVDYQIPTDPSNLEVQRRLRDIGIGAVAQVATVGIGSGLPDPPKTDTIESRLRHLIWVNDTALSCDYLGNFDIHAVDAAIWLLGQRPIATSGASAIYREDPHGDARDICSVVFEYEAGFVHNHFGQALANRRTQELSCTIYGQRGYAKVNYWGDTRFETADDKYEGASEKTLYENGARANIAEFHRAITEGRFDNPTAPRAVDGALACVLGREASLRQTRLTMDAVIAENKELTVDLHGLKA